MALTTPMNHTPAQARVLEGLARLRTLFPLEERLRHAPQPVHVAYAQLLGAWLRAQPSAAATLDTGALAALAALDAVVQEEQGLGCYPFSTIDTGIRVTLPGGVVNAMCAIDALAIARLARTCTRIQSLCAACAASITILNEENGGLDHDQVDVARVIWQDAKPTQSSCSQGLCRHIRFLCPACAVPETGELFTLPQAAAIGNAFFRFQQTLLTEQNGQAT